VALSFMRLMCDETCIKWKIHAAIHWRSLHSLDEL